MPTFSKMPLLLAGLAGGLLLGGATSCGGAPKPGAEPVPQPTTTAGAKTASPAAADASDVEAPAKRAARRPGSSDDDPEGSGANARRERAPIEPCKPGSPEHDQAERAFMALDQQIDGLAPTADHRPANQALATLLDQPCYQLAKLERPASLEADSALALRAFWERGGRLWLEHYLKLGARLDAGRVQHSVVPPSMPRTLTRQSAPRHPLRELLCSTTDVTCGQATRGWAGRAELAFQAFARQVRLRWAAHDPQGSAIQSPKSCSALVRSLPEADRYVRWWDCIASLPLRAASLPLGGLDAPREGWLLLQGRRGHYDFCDELRAYDLATGAAYVAASCGRLALRPTGRVDSKTTDAARRLRTITGALVADNIQEATWMLLIADEVGAPAVRQAASFSIPRQVAVRRPPGKGRLNAAHGLGTSSDQTELAWSYRHRGRVLASGRVTWPSSYDDPAQDHAVKLLQVAEQGLREGCPPARLPPKLDFGKRPPTVSPLDTPRRSQAATHDELVAALGSLRKTRVCRQK